jgi:hypothetical protein
MRKPVFSGSYQNYQKCAVKNQLTDVGKGGRSVLGLGGNSESVDLWQGVQRYFVYSTSLIVSLIHKMGCTNTT